MSGDLTDNHEVMFQGCKKGFIEKKVGVSDLRSAASDCTIT